MFDVLLLSEEAQIAIFLIIAEDTTKYFKIGRAHV